jgi:hypothetical protein
MYSLGLTRSGLEPTICRQSNHYTNDTVFISRRVLKVHSSKGLTTDETIYSVRINVLSTIDSRCDIWLVLVWFMVFNATFNNISGISWRSKVTDKLYHIMLVVIAIDCTGSCKSNNNAITTTTTPCYRWLSDHIAETSGSRTLSGLTDIKKVYTCEA